MKIYLGADHRGFELKRKVFAYLEKRGYDVVDCGAKSYNKDDDYPIFVQAACLKLLGDQDSEDSRAILMCGMGQGVAMAANRFEGIRAAVVRDREEIIQSRKDNDANVLALPADILEKDDELTAAIIDAFLTAPFAGVERYRRRNRMIDKLEDA
ncbi:RpiB/LacA/LacB family sugar-phosphate isomerase [Candidatus Saccharibacteria bacterium]|jgi:ribose 5-phosphate isomerase B|nr:RpiB/LacA/LacB family sugar-phosphate isomerase [Candidatus Saccharibacteria bacterium]